MLICADAETPDGKLTEFAPNCEVAEEPSKYKIGDGIAEFQEGIEHNSRQLEP